MENKPVPTTYETSFTVMPEHTNYSATTIFGGAAFSQLDLAAASAVRPSPSGSLSRTRA